MKLDYLQLTLVSFWQFFVIFIKKILILKKRKQLSCLIDIEKNKKCFDLGCAANVEHKVDTQGHAPFKARPIQRSCASDEEVNSEIQKLLDNGLLVKLKSPWALPLLLVKKKDGTNRVVIDYCKINDTTKKNSYPLPRIDNALDVFSGAKYFSVMI